jgi:dTDP-4-dehydrorhamnose reductase
MKTLVLGQGWVGTRLVRDVPSAYSVSCIDIADRDLINQLIDHERPGVVINAVGKTGRPNVDWCETHREETYRSNVIGALNVANACAVQGAHLIHLGSGCIFNGCSPNTTAVGTMRNYEMVDHGWREIDYANPESFYARTKYAADLVLSQLSNVAIVRLRMPIDGTPHPRNLITKLAGYGQVIDVENSITVVDDLVAVIRQLIEKRAAGIFHAVNPGIVRHRDIVSLYRELVDPNYVPELILASELQTVAPRSNAILADTRLGGLGIVMRPAAEAVRDALTRYAQASR